jgi:hypothetical protein
MRDFGGPLRVRAQVPNQRHSGGCTVIGYRLRFPVEEKRLRNSGRQHGRVERLGDEVGRLRPFSGQQSFWKGGNENNRDVHAAQNVFYGINSARPIS